MYFILIVLHCFVLFSSNIIFVNSHTVCYPPLSCYTSKSYSEPYFLSTSIILPDSPRKLNTSIIYFPTTKSWIKSVFYKYDSEIDDLIGFNASNPIVFIIHGYKNNAGDTSMFSRLKDHIQNVSHNQVNVFSVDWSSVANHYSYSSCIANLPVLGDSVAYFIERLLTRFQIDSKNVHIIGHSLGAHIAAYTGQRLISEQLKIFKITALDPAGPYLRNLNINERLDETDADLVEVYYTGQADYLFNGLGTTDVAGKINIYLNGGSKQPACEKTTLTLNVIKGMSFESLNDFYNCDHHRGFHIYETDIQTKCQLVAYKCDSYENYLKGKCGTCDRNNTDCYLLGYQPFNQIMQYSIPEISSKYYIVTTAATPWCIFLYQFVFEVSNYRQGNGRFIMHLTGETNTLPNVKIEILPEKSNNVTMLVRSEKQLDRIERIQIESINNKRLLNLITGLIYDEAKLEIDRIHINYMSSISSSERLAKSSVLCYQTVNNIFKLC